LIKAVGVTNKEAVDFATTVDREGRAPVFTGPKATCQKLSQEIQVSLWQNMYSVTNIIYCVQ